MVLQFIGKSILFKTSGVEDDTIGTNILGIANVRAVNVRSQSYPLKLDGPIEAVGKIRNMLHGFTVVVIFQYKYKTAFFLNTTFSVF